MKLDLKNSAQFTLENVRALIASEDDSVNRQLRVTKSGLAFLSDSIALENLDDIAFRFETWVQGADYVGIAASQDETWVSRIYEALKQNWPNPTNTYIDSF
jgi:hypothetical protein